MKNLDGISNAHNDSSQGKSREPDNPKPLSSSPAFPKPSPTTTLKPLLYVAEARQDQNAPAINKQDVLLAVKPGKKKLKKGLWLLSVIVLIILGFIFFRAQNLSEKIFVGQSRGFFSRVFSVVGLKPHSDIKFSSPGQINILLLGIGGEGHDGPYLTDTMIVTQIRPQDSEVVMVSLPRDYLVELPNQKGARKINAAFAEGYAQDKTYATAGAWAREAAQKVSGLSIPYFAVLDFQGFQKAIDQVGGVAINVERDFTDYEFPDEKLGYLPPISFKAGLQTMSGKIALQFARSRHAAGPEGSDFARSQRQQKVIKALKDKILALNPLGDIGTINNLLSTFAEHFHTNIPPDVILELYDIVKENNIQSFLSLSLDPSTQLICPQTLAETGAFVLLPCQNKSEQDIQNYFKNAFALGKLADEKAVIWMANGSKNKSAYQKASNLLKSQGLTVWELPQYDNELEQTVVFEANLKPATMEFIKNQLNAKQAILPPPDIKINKDKVDIVIILGKQD